MEQDIRWLQRYDSFHRANKRIQDITESDKKADDLSELEMEGLIQRFEYTFELGWKVLQDLLKYKGYEFVQGPNGTLQKAFEDGLIADHDGWRRMAKARVTTSHTYNEGDATEIVRNIFDEYSHLLQRLDDKLNEEKLRLEMNTLFWYVRIKRYGNNGYLRCVPALSQYRKGTYFRFPCQGYVFRGIGY